MVNTVASIAMASIAIIFTVVLTALLKKRKSNITSAAAAAIATANNNTDPQCSESTSNQLHPPGYEYEVFLSFRGPDTRKGFTDFLYTSLKDAGIRTFRDDEELRTGEEIGANLVKAITQSKISIPIFSKSYAASKWCLKELTLMLECKKEQNQMILPVFYDVTPNEVRHQTGCYASAFKQHEKKYDSKTVQLWREALAEVGGFKGWESENVADGYEGKLVKLIVLKVLNELKKAQLPVTDALVGIEDRVETVKQLLGLGTNDVRIVGIWGMGGIGKTTLAKVIYNQILNGFECCSFLKDIRETARHQGLGYVQSSLVTDLSRYECRPFKNVEEGINVIKDRYRDKRVLILLDDIDHTDQLDALVIRPESFGQGSRIIITTRTRDVLHESGVGCIYEAEQMNDDNALKLFCKHAFRKDTPMEELIPLSGEIIKTTGGLPLALEVIGSYLSRKKKVLWEATLEKLRTVPHVAVQDQLRISYEALEHEEKEIFLDIACFFIGVNISDMDSVFKMWEDIKLFPKVGIDVLLALCLIKITKDEYGSELIWMHDQVRDLGREIVRQENYDEPGKRSRLWHKEEARYVLENQKGLANVKVIRIELDTQDRLCLTSEHFRNLSNLRFLDFGKTQSVVRLVGDFEKLLSSLRWLRGTGINFDSATNLHLPNLVFLELGWSDLTDDWKGWGSIQMMKLKILYLSCCHQLERTFDFSAFPNLEILTISSCFKLKVIDPSIGKLKNLTFLYIRLCIDIEELPHQLGSLVKLEALILKHCMSLKTLPALPGDNQGVDGVVGKSQLKVLDIGPCPELTELPDLSNLNMLRVLSVTGCKRLKELVGFNKLATLERLDIGSCDGLTCLPDLSDLKLLGEVNISHCRNMERLPDLHNLKSLRHLMVCDCEKLEELVGLDELIALEELSVQDCQNLKALPDLSNLKALGSLYVCGSEKLEELIGLGELNKLERLDISLCISIIALPNLSKLKLLSSFEAYGCKKLRELEGFNELENLETLMLSGCIELGTLPDMSKLQKLRRLVTPDGNRTLGEDVRDRVMMEKVNI